MKPSRLSLCIGLAVALLGCAEERPTRPLPMQELPAMRLTDALIDEVSQTARSEPDTRDSATLCFYDEPLWQQGRVDDIQFGLESDLQLETDGLYVLDPQDNRRHFVHGALPGLYGICNDRCFDYAVNLLSQMDGVGPSEFINESGCLNVVARNAWNFSARLIDYNPSFCFVTVRTQEAADYETNNLNYVRDTFWHCSNVWDFERDIAIDSLIGYLSDGSRTTALAFSDRITAGEAFDGSHIWAITRGETLSVFDLTGARIAHFQYPSPFSVVTIITWTDGAVWVGRHGSFGSYKFYLDRLDEQATLARGEAVILKTDTLPYEEVWAFCKHEAQLVLATPALNNELTDIRVLDDSLRETFVQRSPVTLVKSLTSDGSTIWVLHHGANQAKTQATLLSRFTLE